MRPFRTRRPARTPARRSLPAVQSLEGRALMTGLLIDVQPRSVSLVGTDSGDTFRFTFTPGLRARTGEVLSGTLRVVASGGGGSIDRTVNVTNLPSFTIKVDGGAGGDLVRNDTPLRMIALGGSGPDSLVGGSGNDALFGGLDRDTIDGGNGNDFIQGGAGDDSLLGGAGDDVIGQFATPADVPVGWGSADENGFDRIEGGDGNDALGGGGDGDSYLFDADTPIGDDTVIDEGYEQSLTAINANELDFSATTTVGIRLALGLPGRQQVAPNFSLTLRANVRWVDGTQQADRIAQSRAAWCNLYGLGGDDLLVGGSDADRLEGGAGNDTLYGLGGDDVIWGGDGNDQLYGGDGGDYMFGGDGNDILKGDGGKDELYGGRGYDVLVGSKKNDVLDAGGDRFDLVLNTDSANKDDKKEPNDWSVIFYDL